MKKEQWQQVEEKLAGYIGTVQLVVDGYTVTFAKEMVSKNKLGIVTYVNGEWKGVWLSPSKPCPEQQFLRPTVKNVYPAKYRAGMTKARRKLLKEMNIDPDQKWHGFDLIWSSVATIRRHYEKTFKSIELVEVEG